MEQLCAFMERVIWPMDPEADIQPKSLMPFRYGTPTGEEDMDVLKTLMVMLTIGLQGQAFAWKYKFDFDVVWSSEQEAYLVFLNSVRRMWNRGMDERRAFEKGERFEIGVTSALAPSEIDAAAAIAQAADSADFTPSASTEE
jgi:hypothetical protein